jgi:hypothetical protein
MNFLDVILKMTEQLSRAPLPVQEIIKKFEQDAREELFETPDHVREFYNAPENQEKIISGEKGNALALIYASTAKMEYFSLFANFVQQPIIDLFNSKNISGSEELNTELNSILSYLRGQKVIWDGVKNLERKATVLLNHDVEKWKVEGYTEPLKNYKYPSEKETLFDMNSESWKYLISVRDEFSCSTFGIMKIYRLLDSRHYNRSSLTCTRETTYQQ